jgi:hypothetical protein
LTWVKHAATRAAISLGAHDAGQYTANQIDRIADQCWLLHFPIAHR